MDVFDALLSCRAYKPGWLVDAVVDFIRAHTGQMFTPQCVAVLFDFDHLEQCLAIGEKYLDKEEQSRRASRSGVYESANRG
ncbi:hypothetical protein [Vibrio navarrensis]|uniref:hypothetical protein n=1 Tax=Vibrio navarrensis TaxID=29495 RepID=UPI00186A0CF9|nr:hypothetical protein [Vibrio navarrensis]